MVLINAVIRRINQKLAAKGEIRKANHRYRYYYILDMNMNVVSKDIDPKKLARKLGVMTDSEEVKD